MEPIVHRTLPYAETDENRFDEVNRRITIKELNQQNKELQVLLE